MEFLEAVLQRDHFFFIVCLEAFNRRVLHYFIRSGIIFLLNHIGVPLDSYMAFLQEILDWNQGGLDQAAAALLNPIALAAGISLTIDHLEHEGL
jgi:hypothetical protein